jgi:hypothetical protein
MPAGAGALMEKKHLIRKGFVTALGYLRLGFVTLLQLLALSPHLVCHAIISDGRPQQLFGGLLSRHGFVAGERVYDATVVQVPSACCCTWLTWLLLLVVVVHVCCPCVVLGNVLKTYPAT